MKYYVYSDTLGEGDFADSYDEAVKIAKEYAVHAIQIDDLEENEIAEIQIFKSYETIKAKTIIEFKTDKEEEEWI